MRLPEKGNSNSHGASPGHQIISMVKWIRTTKLSKIELSLSLSMARSYLFQVLRQHCAPYLV